MSGWRRFIAVGTLTVGVMLALGPSPGAAQSRAHVYLLRGLMNIFSLGMDSLAEELNRRGIYTTVDNHSDWQSLADGAAARYHADSEGPIILIGHSLGADAVMEMAQYLGRKGVPVALVVPFDCTSSYSASSNVARVLNLTKHYYMSRGPGFHGSLINVDLSANPNIDHLNIDKSARLHARVIAEVLAIAGAHRAPSATVERKIDGTAGTAQSDKTGSVGEAAAKPAEAPAGGGETAKPADSSPVAPAKTGDKTGASAVNATGAAKPIADNGTPIIARPEPGSSGAGTSSR